MSAYCLAKSLIVASKFLCFCLILVLEASINCSMALAAVTDPGTSPRETSCEPATPLNQPSSLSIKESAVGES